MNDNLLAASKALTEMSAKAGISAEEAAQAIYDAMSKATFDPIREAELIRINPSLTVFQKWRLIRRIMKLAPSPANREAN